MYQINEFSRIFRKMPILDFQNIMNMNPTQTRSISFVINENTLVLVNHFSAPQLLCCEELSTPHVVLNFWGQATGAPQTRGLFELSRARVRPNGFQKAPATAMGSAGVNRPYSPYRFHTYLRFLCAVHANYRKWKWKYENIGGADANKLLRRSRRSISTYNVRTGRSEAYDEAKAGSSGCRFGYVHLKCKWRRPLLASTITIKIPIANEICYLNRHYN